MIIAAIDGSNALGDSGWKGKRRDLKGQNPRSTI